MPLLPFKLSLQYVYFASSRYAVDTFGIGCGSGVLSKSAQVIILLRYAQYCMILLFLWPLYCEL